MKRLIVQLQPQRANGLKIQKTVNKIKKLARKAPGVIEVKVHRGEDKGPYTDISFSTSDVRALWKTLKAELDVNPALRASSIVYCQGKQGWDDYLLLHSFDKSEPFDTL